ncbi:Elongation factor G-2, mitochondrial, partial [Mucuna pruriens]
MNKAHATKDIESGNVWNLFRVQDQGRNLIVKADEDMQLKLFLIVELLGSPDGPLVALAFKLEEGRFGQLTYLRIYEGVIRKGDFIINVNTGKKIKVPRLVRMHSDEMEDIQEAHAGQIVAVFGVDCASGDTFTDGSVRYTMTSMNVPEPVMSLAVQPVSKDSGGQFSKALNRFQREDPTFRVGLDPESGQTIISGMGELHLDIYVERIKREYKVDASVGKPRVNFRETVTHRADFDYLHKKQTGGQGQYGRVIGYIEPLPAGSPTKFEFENMLVGQAIPSNFIPAIEKGFKEAANSGALIGHPVENLRVVLTDGAAHAVDSSELAFKLASIYAFRQCYAASRPVILEPVMLVELKVPTEFQGAVAGDINKRKGVIVGNDQEGDDSVITSHFVPMSFALPGYCVSAVDRHHLSSAATVDRRRLPSTATVFRYLPLTAVGKLSQYPVTESRRLPLSLPLFAVIPPSDCHSSPQAHLPFHKDLLSPFWEPQLLQQRNSTEKIIELGQIQLSCGFWDKGFMTIWRNKRLKY